MRAAIGSQSSARWFRRQSDRQLAPAADPSVGQVRLSAFNLWHPRLHLYIYISIKAAKHPIFWLLLGFGVLGLGYATKAAARAPSRALPRRRALCTNGKKPR